MTSVTDIRRDVTKELKANLGTAKLDETGTLVFRDVFDITIGLFAKNNARTKIDVWTSKKFRRFILVQTTMIAREASRHAKNGIISGRYSTARRSSSCAHEQDVSCEGRGRGAQWIFRQPATS